MPATPVATSTDKETGKENKKASDGKLELRVAVSFVAFFFFFSLCQTRVAVWALVHKPNTYLGGRS